MDAVIDTETGGDAGIENGDLLLRFATAAQMRSDDLHSDDLASARTSLVSALGDDALLEAAATIAIFNGLVRVADGTGIQLDAGVLADSSDFRGRLGLNDYAGASNSDDDQAPRRAGAIADMFG